MDQIVDSTGVAGERVSPITSCMYPYLQAYIPEAQTQSLTRCSKGGHVDWKYTSKTIVEAQRVDMLTDAYQQNRKMIQ